VVAVGVVTVGVVTGGTWTGAVTVWLAVAEAGAVSWPAETATPAAGCPFATPAPADTLESPDCTDTAALWLEALTLPDTEVPPPASVDNVVAAAAAGGVVPAVPPPPVWLLAVEVAGRAGMALSTRDPLAGVADGWLGRGEVDPMPA
jgi:hypothetical protein